MTTISGIWHADADPGAAPCLLASEVNPGLELRAAGLWLRREGPARLAGYACDLVTHGSIHLAFDARIDNAAGLARELGLAATAALGELLLAGYQRWGDALAERLLGEFAIVIVDTARRQLLALRDIAGCRPLYYSVAKGRFAFSTAIDVLLSLPGVDAGIDEGRVAQYLVDHLHPNSLRTFHAGVLKLPAAHCGRWDGRSFSIRRYWSIETLPIRSELTLDEAADELHRRIVEAVRCRIAGCDAVGSHASGGIDSGLVLALSARLLRESGKAEPIAYCWAPEPVSGESPPGRDERSAVRRLAAQVQAPLRFAQRSDEEIDRGLVLPLGHCNGVGLFAEHAIRSAAAEDGRQLLLSGWGGDEASSFNGRRLLLELLLDGRLGGLGKQLGGLAARFGRRRLPRLLWQELGRPLLPAPVLALERRLLAALYVPSLGRRDFLRAQRKAFERPDPLRLGLDTRTARQRLLDYGHLAARIEDWNHWGRQQGLRYAYPLLDQRVLEWACSLPGTLYLQAGEDRVVYRRAAARELPDDLASLRSKLDPSHERAQRRVLLSWWRRQARSGIRIFDHHGWIDPVRASAWLSRPPETEPRLVDIARARRLVAAQWLATLG